MKTAEGEKLLRRARRCGIQPVFTDSAGRRQKVGPETLRALVELHDDSARPWPVPPVIVCWNGRAKNVSLGAVPNNLRPCFQPGVFLPLLPRTEGRAAEEANQVIRPAFFEHRSENMVLRIPPLAFGYYDLLIEADGRRQRTLVISAPMKAYGKDGLRMWGVFAPMYAVSSRKSWGAGTLRASQSPDTLMMSIRSPGWGLPWSRLMAPENIQGWRFWTGLSRDFFRWREAVDSVI
jgi:4-alpha-glucanotransferase